TMPWVRDLGRRLTIAGVLAAAAVAAALALAVAPGARTSRRADEPVVVNADPVADTISDCPTTVQDASAGGRSGSEQSLAVDPANRNYVLLGSIEDDLYSHPVVSHDCGQT